MSNGRAARTADEIPARLLLVGFGLANQGVARALLARGHEVVVVDDRPSEVARAVAADVGLTIDVAPDEHRLDELLAAVGGVVTTPGLPDDHVAFRAIARADVASWSEFDLAAAWDDRPIVAITGTDGKTTVNTLVAEMLRRSGIETIEAGNNDLPLVNAIDDPTVELFVVEASSFRIGQSHGWAPAVACWLNLAPDHADVHADHGAYVAAKGLLWASQRSGDVAIGNADDPVVAAHLAEAPARQVRFSTTGPADWMLDGHTLRGPDGPLLDVAELPRRLPHDLANALAAAATASAAGAAQDAIRDVLRETGPMAHRINPVGQVDGVVFYDDSKATTPNATLAAMRAFDSLVLIAGGRNKGLDLTPLRAAAGNLRAAVLIGEAAGELAQVFEGLTEVHDARDLVTAVDVARRLAQPGDAVVLSPACASFDQYANYRARGDHFGRLVGAFASRPQTGPPHSGPPPTTPPPGEPR